MLYISSPLGQILLRPFTVQDVKYQINYLYDSPKDFLREIGFDPDKFIGRKKHQQGIEKRLRELPAGEFRSMVAELKDEVIAVVHLHLGESPKAHFHILKQDLRGKGIGRKILMNCLRILMEKHGLDQLRIEPKNDNLSMNKLMVKCGFEFIERTTYSGPVTLDFEAVSYLVKREHL